MSLRTQLLVIALLTLVLPWAGWRYVQEMEDVLRSGLEQSLLASATTMARALDAQSLLSGAPPASGTDLATTVYAHDLAAAPRVDGYRDDWSEDETLARPLGEGYRYWAGVFERHLYLFVDAVDADVVYQKAPGTMPYGDRVLLRLGAEPMQWLLLHTSAPGAIRPTMTSPPLFAASERTENRIVGAWAESSKGFGLELRIPLDLVGARLGIGVIDVDPAAGGYRVSLHGSWDVGHGRPPGRFVYRPRGLEKSAAQFRQAGRRLRIVDASGWVLFDAGALEPLTSDADPAPGLAGALYRLILRRSDPAYRDLEDPPGYLIDAGLRHALQGQEVTRWYQRGGGMSSVVAAAVPLHLGQRVRGAVILEQGSDSILTLTNTALVRLTGFTLLVSVVAGGALLAYATVLSLRVRRLARAASSALTPQGEIRPALPGGRARDEIGDLARSFTDVLGRLREYTDYLRTLKGKLAHELRTPLAVVSTSLENLEQEPHGEHLRPYFARLREGMERLDGLILSMSEATLIERAIADTPPEPFDLVEVVSSCVNAYRDIYAEREFELRVTAADGNLLGSADLIAQMLDKLIDNAVGFSARDSTISVGLEESDGELCLTVANRGPTLPRTMRAQLFDSLVSVRPEEDAGRHLGLGLYIVALVVRYHKGRAEAHDLPDGTGVVFEIRLPRAGAS
jgi:two-component system sensor histidine kinase ChvG